jgi:hypothetical protein
VPGPSAKRRPYCGSSKPPPTSMRDGKNVPGHSCLASTKGARCLGVKEMSARNVEVFAVETICPGQYLCVVDRGPLGRSGGIARRIRVLQARGH